MLDASYKAQLGFITKTRKVFFDENQPSIIYGNKGDQENRN
jgi:hypothetical protein